MRLFPALKKAYCEDKLSALEAQRFAELIAWGPALFQASRLMVKFGILELINNSKEGMTREDICKETKLSDYAVKCLLEASLCIGTILVDTETDRYTVSKVGWFLLNDPATRVNLDFNHDVNYEGWFRLEESLLNGKPEGLRHFGPWPTVYEGLSTLPPKVRESWFAFDHFYSDSAFPAALSIVFDRRKGVHSLYDIGGNTGKWALQCVAYSESVRVTVVDLPQQIEMMRRNVAGKIGADRIEGYGINLLDPSSILPTREEGVDVVWMSQFLDCFSMEEITSILRRVCTVMSADTRLCIMETLWDRQRFEPAAFCLTMTSLYFAAIANGNSKMYNTEDLETCIRDAGLRIEEIHDHLGQGHSILVVKKV
ncbi:MAG: SAM-dependent methyltransferase [Prevotellaceae bacterium]|nr:SAM-dependent methyltransferase [Prevotellaceae bacterium]